MAEAAGNISNQGLLSLLTAAQNAAGAGGTILPASQQGDTGNLDSAINAFRQLLSGVTAQNTEITSQIQVTPTSAGTPLENEFNTLLSTASEASSTDAAKIADIALEQSVTPPAATIIEAQATAVVAPIASDAAVKNTYTDIKTNAETPKQFSADTLLSEFAALDNKPSAAALPSLNSQQTIAADTTTVTADSVVDSFITPTQTQPVTAIVTSAASVTEIVIEKPESHETVPLYLQSKHADDSAKIENTISRFINSSIVENADDAQIQQQSSISTEASSIITVSEESVDNVVVIGVPAKDTQKPQKTKSDSIMDLFARKTTVSVTNQQHAIAAAILPEKESGSTISIENIGAKNSETSANTAAQNAQQQALTSSAAHSANNDASGDAAISTLTSNTGLTHALSSEHLDAAHKSGDYNYINRKSYPSVSEQIEVKISTMKHDGQNKISMMLEPASLGKIDIQMQTDNDGKMHVLIMAERAETLDLLQKDSAQLQKMFADAGIKSDAGSMQFQMQKQPDFSDNNQNDNKNNRLEGANDNEVGILPASNALEMLTAYQLQTDGLVNIMV